MKFIPHIDPTLPFSTAVIVDGIAYMSGNIGILPDGSLPEGLDAQSRLSLDNMIAALKLAGCSLADVFKCTIMLADMGDWPEFNKIYMEYFPASRLPARSAFGTTGLALGALVEVECLAKVPS
jgi:2-iminobutanoate/2-iminopropanoate deaminase